MKKNEAETGLILFYSLERAKQENTIAARIPKRTMTQTVTGQKTIQKHGFSHIILSMPIFLDLAVYLAAIIVAKI